MRRHTFVTTALWIGAVGTFLLITTLAIPSWLASRDDVGTAHLIGLFYRLQCIDYSSCKVDDLTYDEHSLSLADGTWGFNPVAVPTMILLACILCCIALLIIECMDHKCCWKNVNYRPLVMAITVVLLIGGIIATLGFLLACAVADRWYTGKDINEPVEFPWAMFIAFIALILLWISIIMFFIIVWKWYKYGKSFDRRRVMFMEESSLGSRRRVEDYIRTEKYKKYPEGFNQYDSPQSYEMSTYGSGYSDLRRSKGALPDFERRNGLGNHSPKILRETVITSNYGPSSYSRPELHRSLSDQYMRGSHEIDGGLVTTRVTHEPSHIYSISGRRRSISDPDLFKSASSDNILSGSYKSFVVR